jgi:hypothetical protein
MMQLFRRQTTPVVAPVIALSVLFGAAAGFSGGLMAVDYLYPVVSDSPNYLLTPASPTEQIGGDPVRPNAAVEAAARAQVLFYPPTGGDPADAVYWPAEAVAAGVTLTSDGWLISFSEWSAGRNAAPPDPAKSVAVVGGRGYAIDKTVVDPASGALFLKIEASNLPVISFNEAGWLTPGDSVFAFDAGLGPRRLDVVGYGPSPKANSGAVVSSDELDERLRLPEVAGLLPGAMVLDSQGQVMAIFAGNTLVGSTAVPVGDFSNQLEPIVRDGAVERPWLGAQYLDLARLVGAEERRGGRDVGALLVSGNNAHSAAVTPRSPAAAADLRAGDMILEVNGELISAKRSLAKIISEYKPGDTLRLTVLRGAYSGAAIGWGATGRQGAIIEVSLTLDRYPMVPK